MASTRRVRGARGGGRRRTSRPTSCASLGASTPPAAPPRPPAQPAGGGNGPRLSDEQLACMLQDELFQEELRHNPEFSHLAGRRGAGARGGRAGAGYPGGGHQGGAGAWPAAGPPTPPPPPPGPDFFDWLSGDCAQARASDGRARAPPLTVAPTAPRRAGGARPAPPPGRGGRLAAAGASGAASSHATWIWATRRWRRWTSRGRRPAGTWS